MKVYKEYIDREHVEKLETRAADLTKRLEALNNVMYENAVKIAEIADKLSKTKNETELYKNLFELQKISLLFITEVVR